MRLIDHNGRLYQDYTDEVAEGARWLDEVAPGWDTKIDLEGLQMATVHACVLGQAWMYEMFTEEVADEIRRSVEGTFSKAFLNEMRSGHQGYSAVTESSIWPGEFGPDEMGFTVASIADAENYEEMQERFGLGDAELEAMPLVHVWDCLRDAWLELIEKRRANAK